MADLTIRKTITVDTAQDHAFKVFTEQIGSWWPLDSKSIGAVEAETAILEPQAGGRWFERGVDGSECDWGKVIVYEPPARLVLNWQIGADWRYDVKQGQPITFVNEDQFLNIRHSVTTCPWPCNGRYVSNYPHADGAFDSGTLGYDVIDGGSPEPVAATPPDLGPGVYSYFCRIHPWMRGAFRVEPPGG